MNTEREVQRPRNGTHRISRRTTAWIMTFALIISMLCPILVQAADVTVRQAKVYCHHDSFSTNGWKFSGSLKDETDYCYPKYRQDTHEAVYCIEPAATMISQNGNGTPMNKQPSVDSVLATANNPKLSTAQMKDLFGRIIQNGLSGKVKFSVSSSAQNMNTEMAEWLATQILIWETLVGQRDANFNYVEPTSGKPVKTYAGEKWSSMVKSPYERIEKAVKESLKNSITPQFMFDTKEDAAKAENVRELKPEADGKYSLTLTDTNNVLDKYTLSADSKDITITPKGNTLTITSDKEITSPITITGTSDSVSTPEIFVLGHKPLAKKSSSEVTAAKTEQDVVGGVNSTKKVYLQVQARPTTTTPTTGAL